jgi:hypothetical protein
MLKIAVVGNTNHQIYIKAIDENPDLTLTGIFDPSFPFEIPKDLKDKPVFCSFADMLSVADAIVFAATENSYFPFMELAIQCSKPVFIHSTFYLNFEEHQLLLKLKDEAGVIVQVYHSFIFHDAYAEYLKVCKTPLLIDCHYSGIKEKNLLPVIRQQVSGILSLFSNNIRRVTANTLTTFSEIPDIITLRIDFNNGSIANIVVNSVEKELQHIIKTYEYGNNYRIDFNQNFVKCTSKSQEFVTCVDALQNTTEKNIAKQLGNFYQNILNHHLPVNSIENEIVTLNVMEKVKEKLRVCFNFL